MRIIKATETRRYADSKAYMPQRELVKGVTYKELSDYIIDSALANGFAELVEEEGAKKIIEPEIKEGKKSKHNHK